MRWGALRDHFKGVAWKRLTPHEVDPRVSNGHEFQGVGALRELLGETERRNMPAKYLLLADDPTDALVLDSTISWYDSRVGQAHRAAEWRLYYPKDAGAIQARMLPQDLVLIALPIEGPVAIFLAKRGSRSELLLARLFRLKVADDAGFAVRRIENDAALDYAAATILDELGLADPMPTAGAGLDAAERLAVDLIREFPESLPSGRVVSAKVQEILPHETRTAPDAALSAWIETEAAAFRLWEDALIARTLKRGFVLEEGLPDVESFRAFTMRLRQSRVSRAGGALQIHVARILRENGIVFEEQVQTENGERPDFVLPSARAYHDESTSPADLAMIATKFTLKDRWRQVLNEARRIAHKHLLTVDSAISSRTLAAIGASGIQLVMPREILLGYADSDRGQLWPVSALVAQLQKNPAFRSA